MTRRRASPSLQARGELDETTSSSAASPPARSRVKPTRSPFVPTRLELRLLLLYPATLLFGSIFSSIAPYIRASSSKYSSSHQSFQPQTSAPSYFAQKRNIFNLYFVKIGWFWSTVSLAVFLLTHHAFQKKGTQIRALIRWATATVVWLAVTQWFFGPPLIDRSFRLTGGSCDLVQAQGLGEIKRMPLKDILTHAQCKFLGGTWSGGLDISGHVFLLILGSGMLWMEILPLVLRSQGLREHRVVLHNDGTIQHAMSDSKTERDKNESQITKAGVKFAVGVLALMWWMLLMTAAFFHSWVEKLSGLVVAFFALWAIYFLPRGVPVLRSVLGMPGI